jgi:DNA-binding CsgD family transcriptional regulator
MLSTLIEQMVSSRPSHDELQRYHWTDLYLRDEAFARFITAEQLRAAASPDPRGTRPADRPSAVWTSRMWLLRNRDWLAVALLVAIALAIAVAIWQRRSATRRHQTLSNELARARESVRQTSEQAQHLLRGMGDQIDRQLEAWGLTAAEKEVATLMLKGLRHKEIASVRGTSERTVRQQALTVYRKAGVEGRTELAAFFVEDFLPPPTDAPTETPREASRKSA